MVTPIFNTNINIPQGPFLDETTGRPSAPWLLWLQNPNLVGANLANPLSVNSGGTQVTDSPANGQVLIGANGAYQLNNLTPGRGMQVVNGDGSITIDNTGVLKVSGGNTGLTVTDNGSGVDTVDGTLNEQHGGTNQTTYAAGDILYAAAPNTLAKLAKPSILSFLQMDSTGVPSWEAATGTVVTSFSGGTTGLTPSTPTKGAIVLGGILNVTNGGTGANNASSARTNLGLGTIATKNIGVSGTFTTADVPPLTITVTDGIITSIV